MPADNACSFSLPADQLSLPLWHCPLSAFRTALSAISHKLSLRRSVGQISLAFARSAVAIMVRLTADLILESPQYFNAVREREIDLRGNKIAVIENLGATEDLFDSIDLSDNEIVKLEGFPLLRRLSTLLLCNNRITRISPQLGTQLPKLQTLVLANNRLTNLADLDPLASLAHSLTSLSLLDNTVIKKPKYRLYAIHLLPKLRLLDFRKVKLKERQEAEATFGKDRTAAAAAKRVSANTFVPGEALAEAGGAAGGAGGGGEGAAVGEKEGGEGAGAASAAAAKQGPTPEQITAIKVSANFIYA
ncbi:unnamed protein product [Closterium sp. Yama58-4]|nr:unnamed protein product [Closterium sp. Yama58-4]